MIDCDKNDKHATTVEDQDQTKDKDLDPTQDEDLNPIRDEDMDPTEDEDPKDEDPKYTDQVLNRATFTGGSTVVSHRTPSLC